MEVNYETNFICTVGYAAGTFTYRMRIQGNTDYPDNVDATTSASIVIDKDTRYGTTEYIANMIAKETGGDLHRIETITPYTEDFDELRDMNHDEMNRNFLTKLKESNIDISAYDTVFIGYHVWATDVPQAVVSFLNEYNLSGKTVIPFCTHDGYGAGGSYKTIMEASHAAASLEGIAIEAKDVPEVQTDNPNLSVDVIPIGRVTSELSVFDSLDSREDITFSLIQ